jgi:hypothetical protein
MKSSNLTKIVFLAAIVIAVIFGVRFGLQTILRAHDTAAIRTIDETVDNQRKLVISIADLTRQNSVDRLYH